MLYLIESGRELRRYGAHYDMLADMQTEVVRRLFTVEEYDRMVETGILTKEDRVELIEGEILEMSPIGDRNAACTDRATMLFAPILKGKAIVRVQGPVRLSDYTKPQPDVILLNYRKDYYASAAPVTKDALLVIEVADTSIRYDRGPSWRSMRSTGFAKCGLRTSPPTPFWCFENGSPAATRQRSPSNQAIQSRPRRSQIWF